MRRAVVLVLGLLLAVPLAAARAADVPAGADKVVLDVLVKDKKGVAVPDLKPEEIEVLENGSKRPAQSVRFVKPGEAEPGVPATGTLVSLVFTGGDQNQQKRAKQAVEELLKNDLGPDTWIAVFRLGLQMWTVQPFTKDLALVRQAVDKAASSADLALAAPDQAARTGVAEAMAQLQQGKGDPAEISRAEVLGRIIRQGDRLLRQQQEGSALYFLMALAKGQATAPGRKSVLYFTGGLTVSVNLSDFFKSTQSEANRAHVAFYAVDVSGLSLDTEAGAARDAAADVPQGQHQHQPALGRRDLHGEGEAGGPRRRQHAQELEAAAQGAEREHRRLRDPRHQRLQEGDGAARLGLRRLLRGRLRAGEPELGRRLPQDRGEVAAQRDEGPGPQRLLRDAARRLGPDPRVRAAAARRAQVAGGRSRTSR